ncbi:hypothetical protein C1H46_045912 [Malus baccata]|uniref:Uncharacterized protein n=1 Tax=Malus baccata TaxID=106549 RepID=A0A540K2P4_MALBA|nr:hypothetical protein C1H46_045912 [Malus baccata]
MSCIKIYTSDSLSSVTLIPLPAWFKIKISSSHHRCCSSHRPRIPSLSDHKNLTAAGEPQTQE